MPRGSCSRTIGGPSVPVCRVRRANAAAGEPAQALRAQIADDYGSGCGQRPAGGAEARRGISRRRGGRCLRSGPRGFGVRRCGGARGLASARASGPVEPGLPVAFAPAGVQLDGPRREHRRKAGCEGLAEAPDRGGSAVAGRGTLRSAAAAGRGALRPAIVPEGAAPAVPGAGAVAFPVSAGVPVRVADSGGACVPLAVPVALVAPPGGVPFAIPAAFPVSAPPVAIAGVAPAAAVPIPAVPVAAIPVAAVPVAAVAVTVAPRLGVSGRVPPRIRPRRSLTARDRERSAQRRAKARSPVDRNDPQRQDQASSSAGGFPIRPLRRTPENAWIAISIRDAVTLSFRRE